MSRRAIILFVALGIAWGIPYALIKIAVTDLDPAIVVIGRCVIGAALLVPIAAAPRPRAGAARLAPAADLHGGRDRDPVEPGPPLARGSGRREAARGGASRGLSAAEHRLPSSTAGLLLAAVPLVGVAVAALSGRPEPMSGRNWAGVVLGTFGVAALVGLDVGGSDLVGIAMMAVVIVGYAVGPVLLARTLSGVPAVSVVALQLTASAIVTLPLVPLTGGLPGHPPSVAAVDSVIVLGVVCSAVAFLLLFALIGEIGPVRATTITYVNPVVAVVAGVVLLHERITVWTVVGFVLVIGGSVLVRRRRPVAAAA